VVSPNADYVGQGDYWFSILSSDDLYLLRDALIFYERALVQVGSDLDAEYRTRLQRATYLRVQIGKAAAARTKVSPNDSLGAPN
jgi:hypothetical protein